MHTIIKITCRQYEIAPLYHTLWSLLILCRLTLWGKHVSITLKLSLNLQLRNDNHSGNFDGINITAVLLNKQPWQAPGILLTIKCGADINDGGILYGSVGFNNNIPTINAAIQIEDALPPIRESNDRVFMGNLSKTYLRKLKSYSRGENKNKTIWTTQVARYINTNYRYIST